MANNIFFIVSFMIFFFGIFFLYKVPVEVSFVRSLIVCFITELCLGAFIVGTYIIGQISVSVMTLGNAYLILGSLTWGVIIFQKKIQRMKLLKEDVYAVIIIVTWFLIVFFRTFSPSILNVYINSDPVIHYSKALNVFNSGEASAMYFAEVYNAVIMKLLSPFLTQLSLYKAFILADTFANLLNVFMFYCVATTICRRKISKIIIPFLSFLYFAGWPFFSYAVGGFVYLGWGVTLFAYVVYLLIVLYENQNKRNQIFICGLIALGCFAVLVCYLLFVVILLPIVFLSILCIAYKNGFSLKKHLLKITIFVLSIVALVFLFCFFGYFHGDLSFVFNALRRDGWTAKELYQDFLFLMPGIFYMEWKCIKDKKGNILFIAISTILVYIICTFVMCLIGVMSPYYYYKSYYLLWFFAWVINVLFIEYLFKKDKIMLFSCGGTLAFAAFITLSGFDSELAKKNIVVDDISKRVYPSPFPLWDYMESFPAQEQYLPDKAALNELCEYIYNSFPEQEEISIISDSYLAWWYKIYTGNADIYISSDEEFTKTIQEYEEQGNNYVVIYENSERYRKNKELLNKYEIIFNNGYYGIYKLQ